MDKYVFVIAESFRVFPFQLLPLPSFRTIISEFILFRKLSKTKSSKQSISW